MLIALLFIAATIGIIVLPVMIAAGVLGAERNSFGPCLFAVITSVAFCTEHSSGNHDWQHNDTNGRYDEH